MMAKAKTFNIDYLVFVGRKHMKLTKEKLKQIIKEELEDILKEQKESSKAK
jgi:uncharacterized membrane-anchored protein